MALIRSTAWVVSVVGLIASATPALAASGKGAFPGGHRVWNCYPEVVHNCSTDKCHTARMKPGPSATKFGRTVRRLDLGAGSFTVCPNAVDGCDRFEVKLHKGTMVTTVIGNDKGHYTIINIQNRNAGFVRFSSAGQTSWVTQGTCTPSG